MRKLEISDFGYADFQFITTGRRPVAKNKAGLKILIFKTAEFVRRAFTSIESSVTIKQ